MATMGWIRQGRVAVLAAGMVFGAATAQAPGDVRVALVIGNASYPQPATLKNPTNDAQAMSDALRGLGFDVVHLRDAPRADMLQAVQKVRDSLKGRQGIGLLYYAGHALQLDWRNYMIPVDAQLTAQADVVRSTVELSAVVDAFRDAGNRMNILVLDACRDNPFGAASSGKGLAQFDAPVGTLLAYSTAPGNVASDGAGRHGLYTEHLLRELVKPQARIEEVFKRTRYAVRRASGGQQIPWESTSLEDEFMFNAGKVMAAPKPDARQREEAFNQAKADWDRIAAKPTLDQLFEFVARYPGGSYTDLAQLAIERLQKPAVVPQAAAPGAAVDDPLNRFRAGDRYEYVFKDGLTGVVQSRGKTATRSVGDDLFEAVGENMYTVRVNAAGFVYADGSGSYDPPWSAIPENMLQVGRRASGRSMYTPVRGPRQWVDYESRVARRETVDTPMGKLDTFVVEVSYVYQNGLRRHNTLWFEPGWGGAVKQRLEIRPPSGPVGAGSAPPQIIVREMVARSRAQN